MARRNKLLKFTEILTFPNVYENFNLGTNELSGENGEKCIMTSRWSTTHFKNQNPIVLELACGGGEYTLELAKRYPDKNFIGVDIKGARIWKGARKALNLGIKNAAFLRTKIEMVDNFFGPGEVDEIWITFPDPFLKKSKYNRRLTSPVFLKKYHLFLKEGAAINLKTDSTFLYNHTKEVLLEEAHSIELDSDDIYCEDLIHPDLDILTFYEKQHLEDKRTIKFIRFRLSYPSQGPQSVSSLVL
ncbi:MAG: tRNA (guanosine(46)-N7)-methyltransferase TrmB [Saprospiraceae bacterium]|nr:tRNA (guanosine(46)-N7)-methyltransferase TrmB [Bacteroidia bacterium]NNF20958.1 tRNA (guanosine(46)-N7)-methyltransferase TrmB [Saprospiraceae bacterium]